MYESYFGLTGLPFQLGPDTRFFFAASNFGDALNALQRGVDNGARLMVVSGQIGAGKTLLLHTLLQRVDTASVSTVHIVGAHLDATTLAETLSIAFGLQSVRGVRDQLNAVIAQLHSRTLPTLLAIDEAQHLTSDAFGLLESLMQANASAASPLQILLVGQPELRAALEASEHARFKAGIEVHLQLGPLDQIHTRSYIEYRLYQVGWRGMPSFEAEAFHAIHAYTNGVPRRINVLCNRLMMAAFAGAMQRIDRVLVDTAAAELRSEFELHVTPTPEPEFASASGLHPIEPRHAPLVQVPAPPPNLKRVPGLDVALASGTLLYVVAGFGDHVHAAASLRAIQRRSSLPPARLVRVHVNAALALNRELFPAEASRFLTPLSLGVMEWPTVSRVDEVADRFASVVRSVRPGAIIVCNGSDTALACAQVACASGVPVVHLGAGQRAQHGSNSGEATCRAVDRLADMLLAESPNSRRNLEAEGFAGERIQEVGSLLVDAVQHALQRLGDRQPSFVHSLVPPAFEADRCGYGVVGLSASGEASERPVLERMLKLLASVSRDLPLVWPMSSSTRRATEAFNLSRVVAGERIACVPYQPHIAMIDIMRHATCVLTNSGRIQVEALALGVPCMFLGHDHPRFDDELDRLIYPIGESSAMATRAIWSVAFNGRRSVRLPALWDGGAAERMAASLEPLFVRHASVH